MKRAFAFAFAALMTGPALAQQSACTSWEVMKATLAQEYHETETGGGFLNPQAVLVLLMSPGGETWTIAALGTDGQACIMSSGRDWFQRSIPSPEERPS